MNCVHVVYILYLHVIRKFGVYMCDLKYNIVCISIHVHLITFDCGFLFCKGNNIVKWRRSDVTR